MSILLNTTLSGYPRGRGQPDAGIPRPRLQRMHRVRPHTRCAVDVAVLRLTQPDIGQPHGRHSGRQPGDGELGRLSVALHARGRPGGVDDTDLEIKVEITDVRCQAGASPCGPVNAAGGDDYTGEVQARVELQSPTGTTPSARALAWTPATGDRTFEVTVPCGLTPTPNTIGSTCELTTTADAVYLDPNTAKEGTRAVWELGQVAVYDGGPDGIVSTAGNSLFEVQGVFVP